MYRTILATLVLFAPFHASVGNGLPDVELELLKDTQTAPSSARSSEPFRFATFGSHVYFLAQTPERGYELYRTDGTPSGLTQLAEIHPGPLDSGPLLLGVAGTRAVVVGRTENADYSLWSLDAQQATRLTDQSWSDFNERSNPVLGNLGPRLILSINGRVWSTDGSSAGTSQVPPSAGFPTAVAGGCVLASSAVVAGREGSSRLLIGATDGIVGNPLVDAGSSIELSSTQGGFSASAAGRCYFLYPLNAGGWTLWSSDGTVSGTFEVDRTSAGVPRAMVGSGDHVYFMTSDASGESAVRLRRFSVSMATPDTVVTLPVQLPYYARLFAADGGVVFYAMAATNGPVSLFVSDGTAAGTRRVFPAQSDQYVLAEYAPVIKGGHAYHAGWRIELANGTVTPSPVGLRESASVVLGDQLIGAGSGPHGVEVWHGDGVGSAGALLYDLWPATGDGADERETAHSVMLGDALYFTHGYEEIGSAGRFYTLTRSDGTTQGTTTLPRAGYGSGSADQIATLGDDIVVSSRVGSSHELYRVHADFSASSMLMGVGFAPSLQSTGDGLGLIFNCNAGQTGGNLCGVRDDGTQGLVSQDGGLTGYRRIGAVGHVAIFEAAGGIWRSDGTLPGTFQVAANRFGKAPPFSEMSAQEFGGNLYFFSCSPGQGCDLTATDGSEAGTRFIYPVTSASLVVGLVRIREKLVFGLSESGHNKLWASDGTTAGTLLLRDSAATGSSLVAVGGYAHLFTGPLHVVTDGTVQGTTNVASSDGSAREAGFVAPLGEQAVVFTCIGPTSGVELCLGDARGTTARMLPQISEEFDARIGFIGTTRTAVYLIADDAHHGREPWVVRLRDAIFSNDFTD